MLLRCVQRVGDVDPTMGVVMEVDPEILRRFASAAQDASDTLGSIDVFGPFWSAQNALPGSDLQILCAEGERISSTALHGMSQRMDTVARSARGASEDYRVADDEFAVQLRSMNSRE